ncbi:MAG TPA: hypothetical protein VGK87_14685 [Anaerolineae bacterium]
MIERRYQTDSYLQSIDATVNPVDGAQRAVSAEVGRIRVVDYMSNTKTQTHLH